MALDVRQVFPYPSRRMPVYGRAAVATSQPLAVEAGWAALEQGGNAVDAAVAAAITLTVVEPTMNGIGSDAFVLLWEGGRLYGLNASGRSPAAWTPERFAGRQAMPSAGWDAVTVPGCVSAWAALSGRFGRLPFATLFDRAIRHAREGYLVSPITAEVWAEEADRLGGFDDFRRVFLPDGRAPEPGEVFRAPDHAGTLATVAATDGKDFYTGSIADRIASASVAGGGALTHEDLANHRADWVEPISVDYRGYRLYEIPPNGQGLAALIALGILGHHDVAAWPVDSADRTHLLIEAMKLALADAWRYVSDPESMEPGWEAFLRDDYLAARAALIRMDTAGEAPPGEPESDTVYLATADAEGRMVSYIQSNFHAFGSGIVVPGTGIALQNRGSGFALTPGHPNRVGPRKRPFHTIIPGFLTRDGAPVLSFGVMGGPMQAQGHVQMVVRIVDDGQNPQAASDAPRWRVIGGRTVAIEEGTSPAVVEDLRGRGHDVEVRTFRAFGGAQIIQRLATGYCAASDSRKDGLALAR